MPNPMPTKVPATVPGCEKNLPLLLSATSWTPEVVVCAASLCADGVMTMVLYPSTVVTTTGAAVAWVEEGVLEVVCDVVVLCGAVEMVGVVEAVDEVADEVEVVDFAVVDEDAPVVPDGDRLREM